MIGILCIKLLYKKTIGYSVIIFVYHYSKNTATSTDYNLFLLIFQKQFPSYHKKKISIRSYLRLQWNDHPRNRNWTWNDHPLILVKTLKTPLNQKYNLNKKMSTLAKSEKSKNLNFTRVVYVSLSQSYREWWQRLSGDMIFNFDVVLTWGQLKSLSPQTNKNKVERSPLLLFSFPLPNKQPYFSC